MASSPAMPKVDLSESAVPSVYAASIVSIVLSGAFFIGRMVSRKLQRLPISASDYFLLASLCCCWGLSIIDMWMTTVGLGTHFEAVVKQDPSLSGTILMLKVFIVDEVFYDVGLSTVKISILLLYRGLFPGKKFALITNILMGVVVAWCISNLLPSLFSCRPISGFWDLTMDPPPVCINKTVLYVTGSTINIATDVAILCLPIGKVVHLQLHRRTKIALIFVFLLGSVVCVVSIYRFTVLFNSNSPDLTWEFANVLNWSAVELATAIASACLPTMRPLFRACLPASWLRSSRTSHAQVTGPSRLASRHKSYGLSRTTKASHYGMHSEFEWLPESHSTVAESERHGEPELQDVEMGQDHGIMVTETFEMTTMEKERKKSESESEGSSG